MEVKAEPPNTPGTAKPENSNSQQQPKEQRQGKFQNNQNQNQQNAPMQGGPNRGVGGGGNFMQQQRKGKNFPMKGKNNIQGGMGNRGPMKNEVRKIQVKRVRPPFFSFIRHEQS